MGIKLLFSSECKVINADPNHLIRPNQLHTHLCYTTVVLLRFSSFVDYIPACSKLTQVTCISAVEQSLCVPHNQICDYYRDCPGGEDELDCLGYNRCDFQTDMCDWMASNSTLYTWKRYYNHSRYLCYITSRFNCKSLSFLISFPL